MDERTQLTTGRVRPVQVAVGVFRDEGKLLVCQRRKYDRFALKWEFPGGKVKSGEEPKTALVRELKEELGIAVQSAVEIFRQRHLYPDSLEVDILFFRIDGYEGTPVNRAFETMCWVEAPHLRDLEFLEGDRVFVEKLCQGEGLNPSP